MEMERLKQKEMEIRDGLLKTLYGGGGGGLDSQLARIFFLLIACKVSLGGGGGVKPPAQLFVCLFFHKYCFVCDLQIKRTVSEKTLYFVSLILKDQRFVIY